MLRPSSLGLLALLVIHQGACASRAEVHFAKSDALHVTAVGRSVRHAAANASDTPAADAGTAEEESTTTTPGAAPAAAPAEEEPSSTSSNEDAEASEAKSSQKHQVDTPSGAGGVFDYNSTMTHADEMGKQIDSLKTAVSTVLTANATEVEAKSSKYAGLLNEQDAGMRAMANSIGLYRVNLKDTHNEHVEEVRTILQGSGEGFTARRSKNISLTEQAPSAEEKKTEPELEWVGEVQLFHLNFEEGTSKLTAKSQEEVVEDLQVPLTKDYNQFPDGKFLFCILQSSLDNSEEAGSRAQVLKDLVEGNLPKELTKGKYEIHTSESKSNHDYGLIKFRVFKGDKVGSCDNLSN